MGPAAFNCIDQLTLGVPKYKAAAVCSQLAQCFIIIGRYYTFCPNEMHHSALQCRSCCKHQSGLSCTEEETTNCFLSYCFISCQCYGLQMQVLVMCLVFEVTLCHCMEAVYMGIMAQPKKTVLSNEICAHRGSMLQHLLKCVSSHLSEVADP